MKPSPSSQEKPTQHLSRLALSEYVAGAATPAEIQRVKAHVAECDACKARIQEAQNTASRFSEKFPSLEYFRATRRHRQGQVAQPMGLGERWLGWMGLPALRPAFGLLGLLVIAFIALRSPFFSKPAADLSAKGSVTVRVLLNGQPAAGDTLKCKPGDTLQLGLTSERPMHYAVLYRDDDGPLQVYLPPSRDERRGNPAGENLPHSLILDAAWTRERLYVLWSSQFFEDEAAREWVGSADQGHGGQGRDLHGREYLLLNAP